jgi:hypothetical protein
VPEIKSFATAAAAPGVVTEAIMSTESEAVR